MKISLIKTLILAGFAVATSVRATDIYNNIGATIDGSDPIGSFGPLYDSFTPTATTAITGLELSLVNDTGGAGTITVGLYSDASTSPGTLIATLGTLDDTTITSGDYAVSLLTDPTVSIGTRYWIGLSDSGPVSWNWSLDTTGTGVGTEFFGNQDGVFANAGNGPYMMGLTAGAAVPDAGSTVSFLGICLAGLAGLRRKISE